MIRSLIIFYKDIAPSLSAHLTRRINPNRHKKYSLRSIFEVDFQLKFLQRVLDFPSDDKLFSIEKFYKNAVSDQQQ